MVDGSASEQQKSLGDETEALATRLSVIVSTVTSISTLLICLSSDALSSSQLLWVATALCAACFGFVYYRRRPLQTRAARRAFGVALALTCTAIAAAWAFAFRDELRFSKWTTSLSGKPSVLIDPAISRVLLVSKAGGAAQERLASFVDGVIPTPHRTRICTVEECPDAKLEFSIGGMATDSQFSFEFSFPRAPRNEAPPSPTNLAELVRELGSPAFLLQNAFDDGVSEFRVTTTPERAREALRAGTLLATAVRVTDQRDPAIKPYLIGFSGLLRFFADDAEARRWLLDGALYAASYFARINDLPRALSIVEQGATTFPGDARLLTAKAYLRLASNQPWAADIPASEAETKSSSLNVLRGVVALKAGSFWEAAALFEQAADNLGADGNRYRLFTLRSAAALLAAMTRGNPIRRGTHIVSNAEQAAASYPKARLVDLLRAFGMTLRGNRAASEDLFEQLGAGAATDADRATLRFWRALALAETGSEEQAQAMLAETAEYGATDAQTLGLLAQLMHAKAEDSSGVETSLKVARKALEKDDHEVRSNRLLGLRKARQADSLRGRERRALKEEALAHLEKCIASGGGDAEIYSELSAIYRSFAKAIPARDSSRKALDLMCSLDGSPLACAVVEIRNLLESSSPRQDVAAVRTNELLQWLMDNPPAVKPFDRDNMLIEAAVVWYEHGEANWSQLIYENVLANMRQYQDRLERRAVSSLVTCNLGFIYVDKGMTVEATKAFRSSLSLDNSPDCQAGLAIALKQAGQDAEALTQYQNAKTEDANYEGEIEVLQKNNFWSQTARNYLMDLVKADRAARVITSRQ